MLPAMLFRIQLLAAATMLALCANLAGQNSTEDAPNCKDSKLLSRLPGCFIQVCDNKDFDQLAIRTGPHKEENDAVKTLEGVVENLSYECPGKLSPLQVIRNASAALQKAGYQAVFNGKDENDYLSFTMRKVDQWVQVSAYPGGDNNSITFYTFKAVAVSAMKQEMAATAEAMASELQTSGRMALYGINFATNSAAISSETSDKVLGEIVTLLNNQPTLTALFRQQSFNARQRSQHRFVPVRALLLKRKQPACLDRAIGYLVQIAESLPMRRRRQIVPRKQLGRHRLFVNPPAADQHHRLARQPSSRLPMPIQNTHHHVVRPQQGGRPQHAPQ